MTSHLLGLPTALPWAQGQICVSNNFTFVGAALEALRGKTFSAASVPQVPIFPLTGDSVRLAGLESYHFFVKARMFEYSETHIKITYLLDMLAREEPPRPELKLIK